jgi:hypothetical protein
MPLVISNAWATASLFIQFLIFVYLYPSSADRPRFFRYLIWAWGLMVVLKVSYLSFQLFPEAPRAIGWLPAAGVASTLCILAASMAYRWDYRIHWPHALVGAVYALGATVLGAMSGNGILALPWRSLLAGGPLIAGGLIFWPWRIPPVPYRGERFLATALILRGLHGVITPFIPGAPGTGAAVAVQVTFILCYYLGASSSRFSQSARGDRARAGHCPTHRLGAWRAHRCGVGLRTGEPLHRLFARAGRLGYGGGSAGR